MVKNGRAFARLVQTRFGKIVTVNEGFIASERMSGKNIRILWPSQEYVRVFEPQIAQILAVIADVRGIPGIRSAWVSDRSHVDHFLIGPEFTEEKYRGALEQIAEALNIQIGDHVEDGYLIEIAQKMIRGS